MSNGPRNDVPIAMDVSVALCGGPQHSCDVTRDRGFLGENSDCPGFTRWVDQSSILAGARSRLRGNCTLFLATEGPTRESGPPNHDSVGLVRGWGVTDSQSSGVESHGSGTAQQGSKESKINRARDVLVPIVGWIPCHIKFLQAGRRNGKTTDLMGDSPDDDRHPRDIYHPLDTLLNSVWN